MGEREYVLVNGKEDMSILLIYFFLEGSPNFKLV